MIQKRSDYDSAAARNNGFRKLPKGGYVCKIIKATEEKTKTGKDMIHIGFDIAEGDYKGYFADLFKSRKERSDDPLNVKWPFEGQMWVVVDDYEDPSKTSAKFAGMCTAVEESGTKVWTDNGLAVDNFVNASVGIIFQDQEQEYNGKTSWRAIPIRCRSVETIREGGFSIPDDKPLSTEQVAKAEFGFAEMNEDDCPF